jgi:hypothetical protein
MAPPTKLSEKHWKMLEMLENDMSRKDVAKAVDVSEMYLGYLCVGNVEKAGKVATLFKTEYTKIMEKSRRETNDLLDSNLKLGQKLMKEVMENIQAKKKKTAEDKKILSMYTNAIAKCKPATNIKNLSFSYTKGLGAEELMHEFKRLTTIAEASFDRRSVSETAEGRAGELSEVDE